MAAKLGDVFRKNLRDILLERGMTQQDLAKLADTKSPNISRIISGKERVSLDRAGRIAKALKTDLSLLISTK